MIESAAAHQLTERLKGVEDRLERLLTSGWRQARAEAADLRQEADALSEAGLPQIAARLAAVADATGPTEALQAIALASSACRLLRARLPISSVPADWTPLAPTTKTRGMRTEALYPISRALLGDREVWVCTRSNRNEMLLIEPPFPDPTAQGTARDNPEATARLFERLLFQMTRVLGEGRERPEPTHWLNRWLSGTLRWRARYPLGQHGDVGFWKVENPDWATEQQDATGLEPFQNRLGKNTLQDGAPLFWNSGGFRIRQLERDDPAAYVWLDPTAAEAFQSLPFDRPWAVVWMEGAAIVPVAVVTPTRQPRTPRIIHLLPGAPSDALAVPS